MKTWEKRTKISDFFPGGYEPNKHQKEFARSVIEYRKAGIYIEPLEPADGDNPILNPRIKITQRKLINGYVLNQKQLVQRAKSLYKPLGYDVKVVPVVWSLDTDEITLDWISAKMDEFGLKRNDLIKQLAINKSELSKLFSGTVSLSYSTKAKFFWYFMVYELNQGLREQLELE